MKKLLSIVLGLAGLSLLSFAHGQVILELINPATGTANFNLTPGDSFSLNVEVLDTSGTVQLAGFDITLADSTTANPAVLSGASLGTPAFTTTLSDFNVQQDTSTGKPLTFTAGDGSSSDDLTINSTPITLLTVNFTTSNSLATGTYDVDLDPAPGFLDLITDSPSPGDIPFTPENASFSVPEPPIVSFLFIGLPGIVGLFFLKRFHSSECRGS
jgi:hypothetical protein